MRYSSFMAAGLLALVLGPALGLAQAPGGGAPQGPGGGTGFRRGGGGGGGGGGFGDPSQMFDRFSNGKDVWLRSETDERRQGFFDRIAQGLGITNGQITREQFTNYMQQQRQNWGGGGGRRGNGGAPGSAPGNAPGSPAQPGTATPGNGQGNPNWADQWAENMFRRLDANGDGLLNFDEMPEALRAERDKWDTNKDGFIDLNEYKAYFRAMVQQRMAENGGGWGNWQGQGGLTDPSIIPVPAEEEEVKKPVVYRAGNLPKELPSWFKDLDTDNDGQIGLYEWKTSGRSLDEFRKIDRNNDGFLTIDEVLRYEAERKKATGSSSSPGERMANQGPGGNQGSGGFRGPGGVQGQNGGRNRPRPGGG